MPHDLASPALDAAVRPGQPTRLHARPQRYLHAGQILATAEPVDIVTVLGSCVAVCLFDPAARVGGMNHYLLPHPVHRETSARFGRVAIPQLIEEVLRAGAGRDRLLAKVFGGACVIEAFRRRTGHLGQENVDLALAMLAEANVAIVDRDVGGNSGRKLVFHVDDGSVSVRHL